MYEFCMTVPVSAKRIGPVRGMGAAASAQRDSDWEALDRLPE